MSAPSPDKLAPKKIASATVEACWTQIESAMRGVFAVVVDKSHTGGLDKKNTQSQMVWYNLVFQSCNPGQGGNSSHHSAQIIYDRAVELVSSLGPALATALTISGGQSLLLELSKTYSNYRVFVRFVTVVLAFIPRVLTSASALDKTLLELYKEKVFKMVVSSNLLEAFLSEIDKVRRGESVNCEMARGVVGQCCDFAVYVDDLEGPLLKVSEDYFHNSAVSLLPSAFMEHIDVMLQREIYLCDKVLAAGTRSKLMKLFDATAIEPFHMKVLKHEECGLRALMEDNKWNDVSRMFRIVGRLDKGLERMADVFAEVISTHGSAVNQLLLSSDELGKHKIFINECINLHEKYTIILKTHLENHPTFSKAVRKAFETFLNEKLKFVTTNAKTGESEGRDILSCEQLVQYVDALLRRDADISVTGSEEEGVLMEKCISLLVCMHDRDIFQESYKVRMAKRLLQASSSDDSERTFLEKMQRELGQSYTHHMEQMLKDLDLCRDLQKSFIASTFANALPCEFSVQVLTMGYWPQFKAEKLVVPTSLRLCFTRFEEFYKKASSAHEVRKLNWVHALGSAQMLANFTKGPKELNVTNYQALITLFVEQSGPVTVQKIADGLGMEISKVKPHLASLCMQKAYQVLRKVQAEGGEAKPGLADTDVVEFNDEFTYKLRKFKVPAPTDPSERKAVIDKATDNRKFIVEACIVRVMKSRREMKFQALVNDVTDQLSRLFQQDVKFIKARIGELVVRGYLERDESDLNTFRYLTH